MAENGILEYIRAAVADGWTVEKGLFDDDEWSLFFRRRDGFFAVSIDEMECRMNMGMKPHEYLEGVIDDANSDADDYIMDDGDSIENARNFIDACDATMAALYRLRAAWNALER